MIKFNNFPAEYQAIKSDIDADFGRVLSSGRYILGDELSKFEKSFAQYLGAQYCVGVASGTDALTISLMALDIGEGDEVITTSLTAYPSIVGILNAGAKPIVVDINEEDALINANNIEVKINKNTKAIMPVHLYGQCCNMGKILEIAFKNGLHVIEDCAQSTGSKYNGQAAGTMGVCGAFSFYPTKNLGCYGDGGAIITNNEKIYHKARLLRNYGQGEKYQHGLNGINSRLDEIQAAVLTTKLQFLDKWNQRRREIAKRYSEALESVKLIESNSSNYHTYHLFVVRSKEREALIKYLADQGVETSIHYPIPVNKQLAYPDAMTEDCVTCNIISKEIFSLPVNPWLKDNEVDSIIDIINRFPNE